MKILVVGGGGREHAIAWRLSEDDHLFMNKTRCTNVQAACRMDSDQQIRI